jgi:hypothetical protein
MKDVDIMEEGVARRTKVERKVFVDLMNLSAYHSLIWVHLSKVLGPWEGES